MRNPTIVTSRIDFLPWVIWQAWDDNLGADSSPIGEGRTEDEAIADLLAILGESSENAGIHSRIASQADGCSGGTHGGMG